MSNSISKSVTDIFDSFRTNFKPLTDPRVQTRTSLTVTGLTTALVLTLTWTYFDFRAWLAFGTGGTPATFKGYLRMTRIRLGRMFTFNDDLTDASMLNGKETLTSPANLPADFAITHKRAGPRPKLMSRTMPQRQQPFKDEEFDSGIRDHVARMMASFAAANPDVLVLKPSHTEGYSAEAIYANPTLTTYNPRVLEPKNSFLAKEIAHAHPSESSLHVWVSECDAKKIVESGWGERFPLTYIDKGWTMVYAPRNKEEVEVVEQIVRAAVAFVTGVKI